MSSYLDDPKKMHPNAITTITLRINALSGNLSVGWTVAKKREAGRPPSLWKIYECLLPRVREQ
jgi:hypothetical protein